MAVDTDPDILAQVAAALPTKTSPPLAARSSGASTDPSGFSLYPANSPEFKESVMAPDAK
jgi:hypothetical protein